MSVVAPPIRTRAAASVPLRPTVSPMCPNTTAPNGRATRPTANVLNEAIRAAKGDRFAGKNTVGNTSAAAVPYSRKSYYSMLEPARPISASCKGVRFRACTGLLRAVSDPVTWSLLIAPPNQRLQKVGVASSPGCVCCASRAASLVSFTAKTWAERRFLILDMQIGPILPDRYVPSADPTASAV